MQGIVMNEHQMVQFPRAFERLYQSSIEAEIKLHIYACLLNPDFVKNVTVIVRSFVVVPLALLTAIGT